MAEWLFFLCACYPSRSYVDAPSVRFATRVARLRPSWGVGWGSWVSFYLPFPAVVIAVTCRPVSTRQNLCFCPADETVDS